MNVDFQLHFLFAAIHITSFLSNDVHIFQCFVHVVFSVVHTQYLSEMLYPNSARISSRFVLSSSSTSSIFSTVFTP